MTKKRQIKNSLGYMALLVLLTILTILVAVVIKKFIGYGTYIAAQAGYVTQVNIQHITPTPYWFGLNGLVFVESTFAESQTYTVTGPGINSQIFVYNCVSPTESWNELYATLDKNIDLSAGTVRAGTTDMLDNWLNISPAEKDSARNTFNKNVSILLGSTNISGIPAVYTYVNQKSNDTFFTGILNVSNQVIMVSRLYKLPPLTGYKGSPVTYQKILPVPNSSATWYFYRDPYDTCPIGTGTGIIGDGIVIGYAIDKYTNQTLANITVSIGGTSNTTDNNGFYNLTVANGKYVLVGIKQGYISNISNNVIISIGQTTVKNITLTPFPGLESHFNRTLTGIVYDNTTNLTLSNVTISIAGRTTLSNDTGNYSIIVLDGIHNLVAIKTSYDNFIGDVTINSTGNNSFNIYMVPISISQNLTTGTGETTLKGIIEGYILDNRTNQTVPNVTITIASKTTTSNNSGYYRVNVTEGVHYLIAKKSGYNKYKRAIGVIPNLNISHNITLISLISPSVNISIAKIVLANTSNLFNFTQNFSTLIYLNPTRDFSSVEINSKLFESNYFGVEEPEFRNLGKFFEFISNISASDINNITIVISYEDTLPNIVPYLYDNVTEVWVLQNYTINNVTKVITFLTNHFSVYLLGEKTGTLEGTIKDKKTGLPLSNVIVNAEGVQFTTNLTGLYSFTLPIGKNTIIATKIRYLPSNATIDIGFNSTTTHDILLEEADTALIVNSTVKGTVKTTAGSTLQGVIISSAGSQDTTNSSGEYDLIVPTGTHILVGIKEGYKSHIATIAVNVNKTTDYNFTMNISDVPITARTAQPAGAGAGAGAGTGTSVARNIRLQPKEEVKQKVDHEISIKKILKKIAVGNFITIPITISNYKTDPIIADLLVEGDVKPMIKLNKEKMIIEEGTQSDLELTIFGNVEPGVYEGNLIIQGNIDEKIPINVLVYSKERLPVEALIIKLNHIRKTVTAGDELKVRIDLQNLLSEEKYVVSLNYALKGIDNNYTLPLGKEDVVILTSFSLLKNFILPKDLLPGDYTLVVDANYLGFTSSYLAVFTIALPIYKYALFGIIPLWIVFVTITILSTGTFTVVVYKKKKAEKKRYKTEIDLTHMPKAGPRSAFVGNIAETNTKSYFDLDLFQVHTLIAGTSGSGKTIAAQDLVEEVILKKVAVLVFDPTAQWTGFLRKCTDKKILAQYPNFGMKKTDAKAFNGNIYQVNDGREVIDIKRYMKPGEINIFVTNKLDTKGNEIFVSNTIREVFHANLPESKELIFLIVYDGIHSLLPKYGGTGEVFIQVERASREFRKWGVGLLLISQVLNDFPQEVLANINTHIMMRTRDEKDLNKVKEEYGEEVLQSVVKANLGTGMVENANYNKGKPFFVSFRPTEHSLQKLTDEELENYNKYNEIIDDLDYQIEQLEQLSVDVFDLKLELKLSQDKLKSGNFNMVNIYLEGLPPRIKSQWQKIGNAPKKREKRLMIEAEVKEEIKEVKQDNEFNNIKSMIIEANKLLDNNQKEKSKDIYEKIQASYKTLPPDVKKAIYNDCVDLGKKLAN